MEEYVKSVLGRIKHLVVCYDVAAEECARAHIEYRSCRDQFEFLEAERTLLSNLLDLTVLRPDTTFDDKDLAQQASNALKKLRRAVS